MDGNSAKWAPIVQVPTAAAGETHPGRSTREIARSSKTIAAEVARAVVRQRPPRPTPTDEQGRHARADFVWVDDALPAGATPQGDGPWNSSASPIIRSSAAGGACATSPGGLNQRFFDNAGQKLRRRRGRHALCLCVHRPEGPSPGADAPVAHAGDWTHRAYWGENLIDLGKDGTPERLRVGDLPAAGQWVRLEVPVDQAQAGAGHRDRRLGIHPVRRHGVLGQGRHRDRDPAGRPALRFARSLGRGPARRRRGGSLPADSRRSSRSSDRSGPRHRPRSWPRYFIEHAYAQDRAAISSRCEPGWRTPSRSGRRSRSSSRPPWSFARRPASPSRRSCSSEANTTSGARRSAAAVPAFLPPLAAGRAGQPAGTGQVAGRPQPPADGPRGRQPLLAPGLRHGDRQDGRGLRRAGRAAQPSRAARLAGGPVPRGRLGRQADDEAAGDVGRLPAVVAGRRRRTLAKDPANRLLRAGRGSGSMPRCSATRRSLSAACWSSTSAGRASSRRSRPGLWEAVGYTDSNTAHFNADRGADKVHRRSLYTSGSGPRRRRR